MSFEIGPTLVDVHMDLFKFAKEYKIMREPLVYTRIVYPGRFTNMYSERTKLSIGVYDPLFKT